MTNRVNLGMIRNHRKSEDAVCDFGFRLLDRETNRIA